MNISAAKTYIELLVLSRSMSNGKKMYEFQKRCLDGIYICLRGDYIQDPETGKMMGSKPSEKVDKSGDSGIIKLKDDFIGNSLSAKAKNYDVFDPSSGETFRFAEGTKIQNREIFAGHGTKVSLHEGVAEGLTAQYGGKCENWQHAKGIGILDYFGEERKAEVHWFQEETAGQVKHKIKRWLE